MKTHRKIRLKRHVLIKGQHTAKGSILEAPASLAASLVGDGTAEYHESEAADVAKQNAAGVTVNEPHMQSGDPQVVKVSDPPATPAPKGKSGK
jgi:hypothetical protein